jgi:uncharacterized protein YndB with AHSA1/START domain
VPVLNIIVGFWRPVNGASLSLKPDQFAATARIAAPERRLHATFRLHFLNRRDRFATRRLRIFVTSTDRIEKQVILRAPRSRVWRAISNAEEFGAWFAVKLEGTFVEGATISGKITHPGYEHLTMEIQVERIEPEKYFSYRWHPYAVDPAVDYSTEPTTLVEFRLEDADGGTLLTIVESGFDRIPIERRAKAFRMNDQGWTQQTRNIERHVSQP